MHAHILSLTTHSAPRVRSKGQNIFSDYCDVAFYKSKEV